MGNKDLPVQGSCFSVVASPLSDVVGGIVNGDASEEMVQSAALFI
jgi:hypothetical protein